jgi:hypothetical protein
MTIIGLFNFYGRGNPDVCVAGSCELFLSSVIKIEMKGKAELPSPVKSSQKNAIKWCS